MQVITVIEMDDGEVYVSASRTPTINEAIEILARGIEGLAKESKEDHGSDS